MSATNSQGTDVRDDETGKRKGGKKKITNRAKRAVGVRYFVVWIHRKGDKGNSRAIPRSIAKILDNFDCKLQATSECICPSCEGRKIAYSKRHREEMDCERCQGTGLHPVYKWTDYYKIPLHGKPLAKMQEMLSRSLQRTIDDMKPDSMPIAKFVAPIHFDISKARYYKGKALWTSGHVQPIGVGAGTQTQYGKSASIGRAKFREMKKVYEEWNFLYSVYGSVYCRASLDTLNKPFIATLMEVSLKLTGQPLPENWREDSKSWLELLATKDASDLHKMNILDKRNAAIALNQEAIQLGKTPYYPDSAMYWELIYGNLLRQEEKRERMESDAKELKKIGEENRDIGKANLKLSKSEKIPYLPVPSRLYSPTKLASFIRDTIPENELSQEQRDIGLMGMRIPKLPYDIVGDASGI